MRYYFFHSIDDSHASAFKQLSIRHNVTNGKIVSLIVFGLCVLTFILSFFFDFKKVFAHNYNDYLISVIYLTSTSVLYYLSIEFIRRLRLKRRYLWYKMISDIYAAILIAGGMWQSFVMQHNPANTMTMFLIGVLGVGILWLFTARETLILSITTFVLFILGLPYFQVDFDKIWPNAFVAISIISILFCVSRIIYSYHYNYFTQLKTVERKNYEIVRMDRNKTEMLSIVAHDLRSPINSITALINLSKETESIDDQQEYYDLILQACGETDHIIQDLLEVAKGIEEELMTTEVEMGDFLNGIKQQWDYRIAGNRTIQLQQNSKKVFAHIHPQKMQRVLDNLINNAVKFTQDDGVISLHVTGKDDTLHLSVKDNGIGIPEELHPYLFDRFSKAGRNGLNGEKSHGLGLNICKQIIEQHNGVIYVNSQENSGTVFNIAIPLTP